MRSTLGTERTSRTALHRRASALFIVLLTSSLVMTIALSSFMVARARHHVTRNDHDLSKARTNAVAAIDLGFYLICVDQPDTWRAAFDAGDLPKDKEFDGGAFSLEATDPVDGDLLDGDADPVILRGIGNYGAAEFRLEGLTSATHRADIGEG